MGTRVTQDDMHRKSSLAHGRSRVSVIHPGKLDVGMGESGWIAGGLGASTNQLLGGVPSLNLAIFRGKNGYSSQHRTSRMENSLSSRCKRTRPRSSPIDLLLGSLGVKLRGLDAAVVEVALHLIDRHTLPEHLRRPPVAEIVRMDVWQTEVPGGLLDHRPGGRFPWSRSLSTMPRG